jgi:lipoprotein NlpD
MIRRVTLILVFSGLAGCGSSPPAPVSEIRSGAAAPAVPQPAVAAVGAATAELKPGYYLVKKSDTLYSIALEHGQAYRDVAAWNNLDDPNKINIGQQLRVVPPDTVAVAETRPVVSIGGPIEVRPDGVASGAAPPSVTGGSVKREPKGGKLPYSEQALALLQKPDIALAAAVTVPAVAAPAERASEVSSPPAGDDVTWVWPGGGKVIAAFVEGTTKGVDLSGRNGDPVVAAAAGKVVYVGTGIRGYGKMVIIKHNTAFLSVYAHNSQILVKEDQMVAKGQKIAEVGSSDADQAKLHFEIRHLNKPVDPLKYLPGRS